MAKLSMIQGDRARSIKRAFIAAQADIEDAAEIHRVMIVTVRSDGNTVVYTSGGSNLFEKLGILQCAIDTVSNTPSEKFTAEDDV